MAAIRSPAEGRAVECGLEGWLDAALAPQPAPDGATGRDLVRRAIAFEAPSRIPCGFVEPWRSDFFELGELGRRLGPAEAGPARPMGARYRDEWGVGREVAPGLFDRVVEHPLARLERLDDHALPDVAAPERLERLRPYVERARRAGKYVVAADPVLLFERLHALLGFETLLLAPRRERVRFEALLDRLTQRSVAAVRAAGALGGVDGFMTWQELGSQTQPLLSAAAFRELYAPRLARVVRAAHEAGMHFFWHSCGQILDLLPELVAIGVDVLQLDQPRLLGHWRLAERFGGRVAFWNAVDTLWAAQAGRTEAEWEAEVAAMTEPFRGLGGGLMARHYPQPEALGLPPRFHDVTARAFLAAAPPARD